MPEFLRTNYRTTGAQLGPYAIGGGVVAGSWGGGIGGGARYWGGLIMGSFYNSMGASTACYFAVSSPDAIASYFGAEHPLASVSGIRIQPFMAEVLMQKASLKLGNWLSLSDSIIMFFLGSTLAGTAAVSSASTIARLVWAGFICSGPDGA